MTYTASTLLISTLKTLLFFPWFGKEFHKPVGLKYFRYRHVVTLLRIFQNDAIKCIKCYKIVFGSETNWPFSFVAPMDLPSG